MEPPREKRENPEKLALLRGLREQLGREILGQEHVIGPVVRILTRGELGLTDPKRPKGSFLFVGPTGVGKTELTLLVSQALHGHGRLVRFDMSEFQEAESAGVMIGRNSSEGGRMGAAFDSYGENIILLVDEIEKANPLIRDFFLQILDAGRLTLANSRVLNFTKTYVVFTSNIGARQAMNMSMADDYTFQNAILNRVRREFRPEFYARITTKLVFRKLDEVTQFAVGDAMIRRTLLRMAELGHQLEISNDARMRIIDDGITVKEGARPLRGVADDFIESAVADALLEGRPTSGLLEPAGDAGVGLRIVDPSGASSPAPQPR